MNELWYKYSDILKVYVGNSKHGYGVFAKEKINKDEVVEKGLMQVYDNIDGKNNQYLFTWKNPDNTDTCAAGTGFIAIYNHSENPNIESIRDYKLNTLTFVATRDIKKGEELFHKYKSISWRDAFKGLRSND